MDTELVKRAQHGDREAFGLVAADLATRFLAVSRRILRDIDLAEDATQQALVAIWRDLPQLRDPARFDAWSYRLLVHVLQIDGTERLIWQPDEAPTDPIAMPRGESRDALELGGGFLPSRSDTVDGAAGAMASDPISLAQWWRAFCAGEIVSQASLTEMATFYDNGGEYDYGLGLFNSAYRAGVRGVGHLGANFGYKSSAGCLTDDHVVFVVLTNGESVDSQDLAAPLVLAALSD